MNTMANENPSRSHDNAVFKLLKTNRFLQICVAVLIAQLGLATLLGLSNKTATYANAESLFSIAKNEINHIAIDDGDESVKLKKQDEKWLVDGDVPMPVDSTKLDSLINSLLELKAGLPVASTASAREQLDVSDDNYQRKLVVNNDDTTTLLLGTSPGLRKAHLRRDGGNEIYSASLPVSDAPTSVDQWFDKSLLAMQDISRISTSTVTFELGGTGDDEAWSLSSNEADGKTLDTEKLTAAVKVLESLLVTGISDETAESDENKDNEASEGDDSVTAALDFTVTSNGEELGFVLQKKESSTIVKRSDINQAFEAPATLFDELSGFGTEAGWLLDVADDAKQEEQVDE